MDKQNKYDYNSDGDKRYSLLNKQLGINTPEHPHFRFIGDLSNRYSYEETDFHLNVPHIGYDFNGTRIAGENGFGYNETNNDLASQRHIAYFTNADIISGIAMDKGFINTNSSGFTRDNNDQIGGFKIINESGVTYHFALPVYSKKEYQYSENIEKSGGDTFNERFKPEKYAFTWNLTALTGPDYVDRNNNGKVDDADWGHWVEFDYGKWASEYYWRNPGEGFHEDLDANFKVFSEGYKEIYYLDAIRTKTHTALFVKEIRNDGKSAINDTWKNNYSDTQFSGGFYPRKLRKELYAKLGGFWDGLYAMQYADYIEKPTSLLKLSKILLLHNRNLQTLDKQYGSEYDQSSHIDAFTGYNSTEERIETEYYRGNSSHGPVLDHHHPDNVFDVYDYQRLLSSIQTKIIREIELTSDYSLMPNTPNSYPSSLLQGNNTSTNKSFYESRLTGKLTLNSLMFNGKKGANLIPPMTFRYNKNPAYSKDAYDIWGFYKSDFNIDRFENEDVDVNENLLRKVSPQSAEDTDAWSLSQVITNLGSSINVFYSSKSYNVSTYTKIPHYLQDVSALGENIVRLKFFDPLSSDLMNSMKAGDEIEGSMIFRHFGEARDFFEINWCRKNGDGISRYFYWNNFNSKNLKVTGVGIDYIDIVNEDLSILITTPLLGEACACFGENDGNRAWYDFNNPPSFIGGHVFFKNSFPELGGGVKVDQVMVNNIDHQKSTRYQYENGYTSYTPINFVELAHIKVFEHRNIITDAFQDKEEEALSNYFTYNNDDFSDLLANARELPPPGIIYNKVRVSEYTEDKKLPGFAEYEFQPFESSFVSLEQDGVGNTYPATDMDFAILGGPNYAGRRYDEIQTKKIVKKDYSARVGALKAITFYDDNDNPISKTINNYFYEEVPSQLYDYLLENNYENLGYVEETYAHASLTKVKISTGDERFKMLGILSKHERFPLIQTGQSHINFKTGIETSSKNLSYDFLSGVVTKVLSNDSYGNYFVTETTPAYRVYPGMGLAMNGGANMLTQQAESKVYKVNNEIDQIQSDLVSATVQTWSDKIAVSGATQALQNGIWRKHRSYTFIGNNLPSTENGLYPYSGFIDFDSWKYNEEPSSPEWQKINEITLIDAFSHALEAKDVNGNFVATKMDNKQEKVLATVANASYREFAYSGAEDELISGYFGGDVKLEGQQIAGNGHTGRFFVQSTAAGKKGFSYSIAEPLDTTYNVSFWSTSENSSIKFAETNSADVTTATSDAILRPVRYVQGNDGNRWYLFRGTVNISTDIRKVIIWTEGGDLTTSHDDFRVHPIDAAMTSYVYNEWDELEYMLDANNIFTKYEYDEMGRLVRTWRETFDFDKDGTADGKVKTSENLYHYGSFSDWQETGSERCQQTEEDIYTGSIETEEKDMNPNSPTSGIIRYVNPRYSQSCPQLSGNFNLTIENIATNPLSAQFGTTILDGSELADNSQHSIPINGLTDVTLESLIGNDNFYYVLKKNGNIISSGSSTLELNFVYLEDIVIYEGEEVTLILQDNADQRLPQWQDTGMKRCVTDGNGNTGEQEKEQRDVNTLSTSYNTYRWVSNGMQTATCPIYDPTIVTLSIVNNSGEYYELTVNGVPSNVISETNYSTSFDPCSCNISIEYYTPELTLYYTLKKNGSLIMSGTSSPGLIELNNLSLAGGDAVTITLTK